MKKVIIVIVFIVAVVSLSSCRSKKSSCDYGVNTQETQQEVVVACADEA